MERLGEIGLSNENRTEAAEGAELYRLTRVGEVDLRRRVEGEERAEKVDVEEAKADEEEEEHENDGVLEE